MLENLPGCSFDEMLDGAQQPLTEHSDVQWDYGITIGAAVPGHERPAK
jgi:hypothetical protein